MFPNDEIGLMDEPTTTTGNSGDLFSAIADLIGALGTAATNVIGALNSGQRGGVVTVSTPPTASFGGGFDLVTLLLIGAVAYLVINRSK